MLYVFYGENDFAMRRNTRAIIEVKRVGAAFHRLDADTATGEALANLLASERDLFGTKRIVVLDGLLTSDFARIIFDYRDALAASANLYILLEGSVERATLKKLESAAKIQKFELPRDDAARRRWILREAKSRGMVLTPGEVGGLAASGDDLWALDRALEMKMLGGDIADVAVTPNPFEFTEAVAMGDRHRAYALFHKNIAAGVSAQELFWKLWWQAKTLALVDAHRNESSAEIKQKTGLHPFVIQKAERALSRWRDGDVERLFDSLFAAWRDARLDASDLSLRMEKIILSV